MIWKKIGMAVSFALIILQGYSQELGIELDGGLQGMRYVIQGGQTKLLPGGSLGLNYTFKLGGQWGLLTGITGGLYRTQVTLQDGHTFSYDEVDDAGSAFQYNLKFTGYKETQQFFAASIPLLLQYHTVGPGKQWYFNGGGKIFIPFNTNVKISAQQVSLSGYYPDFNIAVSNLPQHGFGTINGWKGNSTPDLKPAAALSAAGGVIFRISPTTRLYTGLYVDFGLTGLNRKNDSMPLATYNSSDVNRVEANSVLNMENASQATLLSFGLQVRLSFGPAGAKSAKTKPAKLKPTETKTTSQPKQKEEPQKPVVTTIQPKVKEEPPKPVVPNSQPKIKEVPQKAVVTVIPTLSLKELNFIQSPVIFGWIGETSIREDEKRHLDDVAMLMKQYPRIKISIVGHYCSTKTQSENRKIGLARAKAVERYLEDKGISRKRMEVSAASSSDPDLPDPNFNYSNRRAVITVKAHTKAPLFHR
jgi:OOP family OmpA-OmpF porin